MLSVVFYSAVALCLVILVFKAFYFYYSSISTGIIYQNYESWYLSPFSLFLPLRPVFLLILNLWLFSFTRCTRNTYCATPVGLTPAEVPSWPWYPCQGWNSKSQPICPCSWRYNYFHLWSSYEASVHHRLNISWKDWMYCLQDVSGHIHSGKQLYIASRFTYRWLGVCYGVYICVFKAVFKQDPIMLSAILLSAFKILFSYNIWIYNWGAMLTDWSFICSRLSLVERGASHKSSRGSLWHM